MVTLLANRTRTDSGLNQFTLRQIQEWVIQRSSSLAVSSLLILTAMCFLSAGLGIFSTYRNREPRVVDFTFFHYYAENEVETEAICQDVQAGLEKAGCAQAFEELDTVRVDRLAGDIVQETGVPEDLFHRELVIQAVERLPDSDEKQMLLSRLTISASLPHLIPVSDYNRLLTSAGKEPLSLEEDQLSRTLRAQEQALSQAKLALADYRDYVESWAHETKTPLSLLTVLLDNRREELGEPVGEKLDYVRNRLQEFVNQMLYYARLTGEKKDYCFAQIPLGELVEEVLEDYRPLLEERRLTVSLEGGEQTIFTDRRGMLFLLSQIVSNAVKYSKPDSSLEITLTEEGDRQKLAIQDHGRGVRPCDLPYLFEKGFTGTPDPEQRSATGMGLYLAKKMAEDLHVELQAVSQWGEGFCMVLWLPVVRQNE